MLSPFLCYMRPVVNHLQLSSWAVNCWQALQDLNTVTELVLIAYQQDKEFCRIPPHDRCSCWCNKALVLRAMGQDATALDALKQAALWDPTSPRPARARAAILFELGRHDEAVIRVEVKDQPFVELC